MGTRRMSWHLPAPRQAADPFRISRWLKVAEDRKRILSAHNAAVRESLNRIEATLKHQSKTSQP